MNTRREIGAARRMDLKAAVLYLMVLIDVLFLLAEAGHAQKVERPAARSEPRAAPVL